MLVERDGNVESKQSDVVFERIRRIATMYIDFLHETNLLRHFVVDRIETSFAERYFDSILTQVVRLLRVRLCDAIRRRHAERVADQRHVAADRFAVHSHLAYERRQLAFRQ